MFLTKRKEEMSRKMTIEVINRLWLKQFIFKLRTNTFKEKCGKRKCSNIPALVISDSFQSLLKHTKYFYKESSTLLTTMVKMFSHGIRASLRIIVNKTSRQVKTCPNKIYQYCIISVIKIFKC